MTEKLSKKFYNGLLQKYNLKEEDLKNYQYAGKSSKKEPNGCNKWRLFWQSKLIKLELPILVKKCICDTSFLINHYLVHNDFNNVDSKFQILIIGSCCQLAFNDDKLFLHCEICSKKHQRRLSNLCMDCYDDEKIRIKQEEKEAKQKAEWEKYNIAREANQRRIQAIQDERKKQLNNNICFTCSKWKKSGFKNCFKCNEKLNK